MNFLIWLGIGIAVLIVFLIWFFNWLYDQAK